MTALQNRVVRLERKLGPDPDDPFGLSNLSIDENELFDRLLKASIQSADAVDVTDLDPLMAEKFSVIISRALRWQEEVAR
jgi:hypothetical protein